VRQITRDEVVKLLESKGRCVCVYCLGVFKGRADSSTCGQTCRKAKSWALDIKRFPPGEVLDPGYRRDSKPAADRKAATGWATMTGLDSYRADVRLRRQAGIEDKPSLDVPEIDPYDPAQNLKLAWWLDTVLRREAMAVSKEL